MKTTTNNKNQQHNKQCVLDASFLSFIYLNYGQYVSRGQFRDINYNLDHDTLYFKFA